MERMVSYFWISSRCFIGKVLITIPREGDFFRSDAFQVNGDFFRLGTYYFSLEIEISQSNEEERVNQPETSLLLSLFHR